MSKWNFDVIFTGVMEDQHCKASHFVRGIQRRIREAEERYADAVLTGESCNVRHEQVHDLETAQREFNDDPRTQNLQKWIDSQSLKEREDKLRQLFDGAIREILK